MRERVRARSSSRLNCSLPSMVRRCSLSFSATVRCRVPLRSVSTVTEGPPPRFRTRQAVISARLLRPVLKLGALSRASRRQWPLIAPAAIGGDHEWCHVCPPVHPQSSCPTRGRRRHGCSALKPPRQARTGRATPPTSSHHTHPAGYALPVIRVQSSWREQKVGLSAVLDASTADSSNSGEDGEPPG
jgi:hypothetical protein